jgi:protein-tyrosine phosphatase
MGLPREAMVVLWRVQPEFLAAAFEEAERSYGSVDAYLREGLRVGPGERERLAALYRAG